MKLLRNYYKFSTAARTDSAEPGGKCGKRSSGSHAGRPKNYNDHIIFL